MGARNDLVDNPVRKLRTGFGLQLKQLASLLSINEQTLYLVEAGCYTNIPPVVLLWCVDNSEKTTFELKKDYREFQRKQRRLLGEAYTWQGFDLRPSNLEIPPVNDFLPILGLTRQAFCKAACVQPALMYKLEQGNTRRLPSQLESALRDMGVPELIIEELNDRAEEHYLYKRR